MLPNRSMNNLAKSTMVIWSATRELEAFENDDQETIIKMIDAMIVKHRVEGAVLPIDKISS